MTINQAEFVRSAIMDRAHCHGNTGEYGVSMPDGANYHGPVWSLDRMLYVLYRNIPIMVVRFNDRYLRKD